MLLTEKQIDKLESLPKRRVVGHEIKCRGWWDDSFKKSKEEYWTRGFQYAERLVYKSHGKPAKDVIQKLRKYKGEKHRSFKKGVNTCIENLTDNTDVFLQYSPKYLVDSRGNIKVLSKAESNFNSYNYTTRLEIMYPQYSRYYNRIYDLYIDKITDSLLEISGTTFQYIVRVNGLLYYVTNTDLGYYDIQLTLLPRLKASHYNVRFNAKQTLALLKVPVSDLKLFGLIDIKENIVLGD